MYVCTALGALRHSVVAGAPFQWAAIFHKAAVRFVRGTDNVEFYSSEEGIPAHQLPCKVLCSKCHSPLADEGRNMWMAFPTQFSFRGRKVPDSFQVSCHIFYGQRPSGLNINDGKPKWSAHKGSSQLLQE